MAWYEKFILALQKKTVVIKEQEVRRKFIRPVNGRNNT